jgi:hypothetical protein
VTQQAPGSYVVAANSVGLPNQDYIILGGGQNGGSAMSPGKAVVRGPNRPQGWDVRKGNALTGATVVPTGAELAKFTVLIEVWAGAQYDQWKQFSATYLSKASVVLPGTVSAKALAISHPQINDPPYSITEVVVEDVVAIEETPEGTYQFEIHFLEYRKPIPAIGKPAAAIPVATKPQPTAQDVAIAANTQRIAALAGLAPPIPSP